MGELFAMFVVKIFRDYSGRYSSWRTWTNLIVATLKAFSKVIKEADPNYREIISDFENCWFDIFIEFDIAFTNKAHVIISHVPQVIARTGRGLFFQSEEVVEATHSKFETFWKRYKVLDVESEQHGRSLLECLLDFNTKNI